jgi:hypothetical protein
VNAKPPRYRVRKRDCRFSFDLNELPHDLVEKLTR